MKLSDVRKWCEDNYKLFIEEEKIYSNGTFNLYFKEKYHLAIQDRSHDIWIYFYDGYPEYYTILLFKDGMIEGSGLRYTNEKLSNIKIIDNGVIENLEELITNK